MKTSKVQEAKNFMANVSSIANIHEFAKGKKPIFRKSCLLNDNGQPLPLDEFLYITGARQLAKAPERVPQNKRKLQELKNLYKKNMRDVMGENWRRISNKLGVYNIPTAPDRLKEVKKEVELVKQNF